MTDQSNEDNLANEGGQKATEHHVENVINKDKPVVETEEALLKESKGDTEELNSENNDPEKLLSDIEPTDDKNEVTNTEDEESTETEKNQKESDKQHKEDKEEKSEEELEKKSEQDTTIGQAIDKAEEVARTDVYDPDPEIDAAVDDIVRSESDETIAEADEKIAKLEAKKSKVSFKQKAKKVFSAWWCNKPVRYGTLAGSFVLLTVISLLPTTRYGLLNIVGVRVSSSMVVIDSQTRLPLKGINVHLQNKRTKTNDNGVASFNGLKLGSSELSISKRGYADNNRKIILGWGSNPIGEQAITATGEQFTFILRDWLSGKPVLNGEATSGENSAKSDDKGKIILTVGEKSISNVKVLIKVAGYRDVILTGDKLTSGDIILKLVPSKKLVFVSNRNGLFDLYKIDLDGRNEEVLLKATGKEELAPVVLQDPSHSTVAVVSSRDGDVNASGFVLDGLFIVDINSGESNKITRSAQVQLIGWSGNRLIYWKVVEGTSGGNAQRSKLVSYDQSTGEKTELATANYFNDVKLVGNVVYYAVSSFAVPQSQAKLYSVQVNGKDNLKVVDNQVWNIYRTEYNKLVFSAFGQKWYEVVDNGNSQEISKQVAPKSKNFIDSPNGKTTAWVEIRDGKGVILTSSTTDFKENIILTKQGLNNILYWANNTTLVYGVVDNSQTADYVFNTSGGKPKKIVDVTVSTGTRR